MSKDKCAPRPRTTLRRKQVAELLLKGFDQQTIAEKLGASRSTISRDLARIADDWQKESLHDYNAIVRRELRKLALLETTAWAEWTRSRESQLTAEVAQRDGKESSRRRLAHRCGDPRFLKIVNDCAVERRKLLELHQEKVPSFLEQDFPSPEEAYRQLREMTAHLDSVYAPDDGDRQEPERGSDAAGLVPQPTDRADPAASQP